MVQVDEVTSCTSRVPDESSRSVARETPLAYGVGDAVRLMGIGKTKFFQLVRDGELKLVKVGRKSLITRAEMEAWITRLPTRSSSAAGR